MTRVSIGMFTVPFFKIPVNPLECGAGAGTRTPDPLITKQVARPYLIDLTALPQALSGTIRPYWDAYLTVMFTAFTVLAVEA